MNRDIIQLEGEYGREFYCCVGKVLDGRVVVSPGFISNYGSQGRSLDFFFIPDMIWGFEHIRIIGP